MKAYSNHLGNGQRDGEEKDAFGSVSQALRFLSVHVDLHLALGGLYQYAVMALVVGSTSNWKGSDERWCQSWYVTQNALRPPSC